MGTNSERILAILEYCNMKAGDFAEKVGVAPATISNIKNGKSGFTAAIAQKIIASFPNFNFQWILLGEGNMLQETENKSFSPISTPFKRQTDELFPIESEETQENSNLPTNTGESSQALSPVKETPNRPEPVINKIAQQPVISSNKTTVTLQHRSIEKIIIYYSDKTFEEYDMTKCKL